MAPAGMGPASGLAWRLAGRVTLPEFFLQRVWCGGGVFLIDHAVTRLIMRGILWVRWAAACRSAQLRRQAVARLRAAAPGTAWPVETPCGRRQRLAVLWDPYYHPPIQPGCVFGAKSGGGGCCVVAYA